MTPPPLRPHGGGWDGEIPTFDPTAELGPVRWRGGAGRMEPAVPGKGSALAVETPGSGERAAVGPGAAGGAPSISRPSSAEPRGARYTHTAQEPLHKGCRTEPTGTDSRTARKRPWLQQQRAPNCPAVPVPEVSFPLPLLPLLPSHLSVQRPVRRAPFRSCRAPSAELRQPQEGSSLPSSELWSPQSSAIRDAKVHASVSPFATLG